MPPRFATAKSFQGGFNFCRLMFTSDHREKQGWGTDYPDADLNFYQQVYFHELGRPVEEDRCELSTELPRIAEVDLFSSRDGRSSRVPA